MVDWLSDFFGDQVPHVLNSEEPKVSTPSLFVAVGVLVFASALSQPFGDTSAWAASAPLAVSDTVDLYPMRYRTTEPVDKVIERYDAEPTEALVELFRRV